MVFSPIAKSFPHFFRDSLLIWTAWIFRIPFSGELAGATFYFLGKNKIMTLYGTFILSKLACLRVLGKQIALHLKEYGIENTIVTDNGISSQAQTYPSKMYMHKKKFRILFVGTLSEQKGFSCLVDACNTLIEKGSPIEVHTMGEWKSDDYKSEIETLIRKENCKNSFILHGLTHGKEKEAVFDYCDILVLPSYVEGQPLVILEALSWGMPVIATNVGGIPDTIKDGKNGYLIAPADIQTLEKKILRLIENPQICQKMSNENLQLYKSRYTETEFLKTQVYWIKRCADGELNPEGQFIQSPQ